jgi:hypothetical protein
MGHPTKIAALPAHPAARAIASGWTAGWACAFSAIRSRTSFSSAITPALPVPGNLSSVQTSRGNHQVGGMLGLGEGLTSSAMMKSRAASACASA